MIVTLSVIGSLLFGSAILNATLNELRNKVDLNVYFIPGTAEKDILSINRFDPIPFFFSKKSF